MKRFRVELSAEVEGEILDAARFIAQEAPLTAIRWLDEVYETIESLATFPQRCTLIPEKEEFEEEIRELIVHSHRIIFVVRKGLVRVLHFRHVSRDRWKPHRKL